MNVYEHCPVLKNDRFMLRLVQHEDCQDLLKVYSDEKAVPFFNSDNCHGDDFFYQTHERMAQAIAFWLFSYQHGYFVRWSIIDLAADEAIGTIELFHRDSEEDVFTNTGLLRLDLRSDYEKEDIIECILSLILDPACELFECGSVSTKAVPAAVERRKALFHMGFQQSACMLKGHDGTGYGDYFIRTGNA